MKVLGRITYLLALVGLLAVSNLGLLLPLPAAAAAAERGLQLTTTYTNIVIRPGKEATLTLTVSNTGKQDENLDLQVASAPAGWQTSFIDFAFIVRGLFLPAGKSQTVDFKAKSPQDAAEGNYVFNLRAATTDGQVQSTLKIVIGIQKQAPGGGAVKLTTLYPEQKGTSEGSFSFSVELSNQSPEDRAFDLSVQGPPRWDMSVRPQYGTSQIRTLTLKAEETKTLDVALRPPDKETPGSYKFTLLATSGTIRDALELMVQLTGTYSISLTTADARLNADTVAGEDSVLSLRLSNTASAEMKNITFSSDKPQGWNITFSPDKLDSLGVRESREINVTIRPPSKTIAGDYSIGLSASGENGSSRVEIRTTVTTATRWGAVGIGIVVIVIAGIAGLFIRMGRR